MSQWYDPLQPSLNEIRYYQNVRRFPSVRQRKRKMTTKAPDLTQKLIGFRGWGIGHDLELMPSASWGEGGWELGVNEASCHNLDEQDYEFYDEEIEDFRDPPEHIAPMVGCGCGLHAYYSPEDRKFSEGLVKGMIAAWGKVVAQSNGFRAQYAEVLCLYGGDRLTRKDKILAEAAAEKYGVPFVPALDMLLAMAQEFGSLMPKALIPVDERYESPRGGNTVVGFNKAVRQLYSSQIQAQMHQAGLLANIPIVDAIAGLHQITKPRVFFIALPVKLRRTTASWTRAIALEEV